MTSLKKTSLPSGVGIAFAAAALFGVSTPFAKLLLGAMSPVLLAGLLYLGSGIGLLAVRFWRQSSTRSDHDEAALPRSQWPWLAGAVLFGGVLAPVLLMLGLRSTTAASSSLLLNFEGVFTAALAWFVFRENFDRRIALGMLAIVAGGVVLSWQPRGLEISSGAWLVIVACACWGVDNNLTQKVSASDPFQIASIKGLAAGSVNLVIALSLGASWPPFRVLVGALVVGFFGYGLSLAFFVLALRHIGTARTGAYFSLAPFIGALVALPLLHEAVPNTFWLAAALMAGGVWLHLTERHAHEHAHQTLEHAHRHLHDEHHRHQHAPNVDTREPHTHSHFHQPMTHAHAHFPDIHHRHNHTESATFPKDENAQ